MSMNCMIPIVVELSESADFVITKSVYDEIITNPKRLGRLMMAPLNFSALVRNGVLNVESADQDDVKGILDMSNNIYYAHHKPLTIIQKGEAEALSLACGGGTLLIDERTLRFLVESPYELKSLLNFRMHRGITMSAERLEIFQKHCRGVDIIRSSELVAIAYEKGILEKYFEGDKKDVLSACLWSLKSKGCSLSNSDIEDYLKMLG